MTSLQTPSKEFWPQDTDDTMYIYGETDGDDIWERIQKKWPGAIWSQISITPEHIHIRHLGFDLYDSADYGDFLCITKKS